MESDTEADTDNILSHGGDLNALSNNRRRRRHKQASYRAGPGDMSQMTDLGWQKDITNTITPKH